MTHQLDYGINRDASNELYHSSEPIGGSDLIAFAKSPWKYQQERLQPQKRTTSTAMELGTMLHSRVLEGEVQLPGHIVIKPDGMEFRSKENKQWRDDHLAAGKTIITQAEWEAQKAMPQALMEHKTARNLCYCKGDREVSIVAKCPDTGLDVKCRPDILPENGDSIIDLKSCRDASVFGFGKDAASFGYHQKAAWYLWVCELAGIERQFFWWVAIESKWPHEVNCYFMHKDDDVLTTAREWNRMQLEKLSGCMETDIWPRSCEGGMMRLQVPNYHIDRMAQDITEFTGI